MCAADYESGGQEFESLRARHFTILHDIVAKAFENTASSRRLPRETLAVRRLDRNHR
jgi:hypothetical protein